MEPNKLQHTAVDTSKKPVEFGDGRVAPNLEHLALDVSKDGIAKSLSNMVTILDGLSCWTGTCERTAVRVVVVHMQANGSESSSRTHASERQ